MTKKEIKDLIKEVKRESGTNEFLSVSDLIVRIEENYKEKGEDIYYEDVGITFSEWNNFLRNTPLSMDLFIGEDAIFEGFEDSVNDNDYNITVHEGQLIKPLVDSYDSYIKIEYSNRYKWMSVKYITFEMMGSGEYHFPSTLSELAGLKIPSFILK